MAIIEYVLRAAAWAYVGSISGLAAKCLVAELGFTGAALIWRAIVLGLVIGATFLVLAHLGVKHAD